MIGKLLSTVLVSLLSFNAFGALLIAPFTDNKNHADHQQESKMLTVTEQEYKKYSDMALAFLLAYSAEHNLGVNYDLEKIHISVHGKRVNNSNTYLVVINSPEYDVFYAPLNHVYRDRAFINIINDEIDQTQNPFSSSAPIYYDTSSKVPAIRQGIYPGSKYFSHELNQIREAFIRHQTRIDFKPFNNVDLTLTQSDLLALTSNKGIFFMVSDDVVCILLYPRINNGPGLVDSHYRIEVFYNLTTGIIEKVHTLDTTPPPLLM
ncbi:hypothetical protein [Motilimonas cestriensis]|uniref:hypothetical protein n=1 Tax=Motilimonas cestriensis TaxID=2742685 RepID=UPI003DA20323